MLRAADSVRTACSTEIGFSKANARLIERLGALRAAHDDQRDGLRIFSGLEFLQELRAAVQIAVHDEGIDLRFAEPGHRPLRFVLDGNVHVKTAEDAFQNTNFLPVARNHHRGKCHVFHCRQVRNRDVDN